MGPLSSSAILEQLITELSEQEDFKYSKEQLIEFRKMVPPRKTTSKSRLSAWQMYRSSTKGIDKSDVLPWEEIKNIPEELDKYKQMAEDKNKERGFSDEDPKVLKKQKEEKRKNALLAAIAAEKQKTNNKSSPPQIQSNEDIESVKDTQNPSEEESVNNDEEDMLEQKSLLDTKEQDITPVKYAQFDEIDENGDGVITRDELEKFTKQSASENEESESEESEEEICTNADKPKYDGKNSHTPLNNFRQWVLQQCARG